MPHRFCRLLNRWSNGAGEGLQLGERERSARSLMWDIGDWWNRGEAYGERAQVVTAGDWTGPTHGTAATLGSVAARFRECDAHDTLTFEHHDLVAPLSDEVATPLLQWCAETDPPHTTQELKTRIQQLWRSKREEELAGKIERAAQSIGHQVYGVLYADPPWRLEPYSRETGLNRAADNHYPTMERDALFDMEVMRTAPAKDCVLFCWATVPMLEDALQWMAAYGFAYRSHCVWVKDAIGTGYWFRNQHEMLAGGRARRGSGAGAWHAVPVGDQGAARGAQRQACRVCRDDRGDVPEAASVGAVRSRSPARVGCVGERGAMTVARLIHTRHNENAPTVGSGWGAETEPSWRAWLCT